MADKRRREGQSVWMKLITKTKSASPWTLRYEVLLDVQRRLESSESTAQTLDGGVHRYPDVTNV